MRILRKLGQKGQTAVEYLLIIVVAMTIGIAFKKKVEEFMIKNPNSFLNQKMNALNTSFGGGRYQTFQLRRF